MEDTPPPTVIGRLRQPTRQPPPAMVAQGTHTVSTRRVINLTRQAATCQAPLPQLFTEDAFVFRIPFGDRPLRSERYGEE